MDRRKFLKNTAAVAAVGAISPLTLASGKNMDNVSDQQDSPASGPLITSAPMLQNFAETSIGIAFTVSDMANGFVKISNNADMSGARIVKCGGFRVTDMNDSIQQIRITGLDPATKYYYTIGADRIAYKGGYSMKIVGTQEDPMVYSFTTAGELTSGSFCVINDTHARYEAFDRTIAKVLALSPACILWNGDLTNCEEKIENLQQIMFTPSIAYPDYASRTPLLLCPGNHDTRGMACRHLERAWMFRQNEERSSRDWDLGRNFAVRLGQIAMIGLDTAEDKVDENPNFAGLFNSDAYRKAQALWLEDVLKRDDIASAPYLLAFCHIPLFDSRPDANPGDVHPDDTDPRYSTNFAAWQRTCAQLWAPLLEKAGCQAIICAHQHVYRFDSPSPERPWAQIIGGGPELDNDRVYPTVIEGQVECNTLKITVHNVSSGEIVAEHRFEPRH